MLNDMRPRRATTILLASLALIAAGCGDDDDGGDPPAVANGGSGQLADAITFELTGGDAFRDDEITVQADGSARIETRAGEQTAELTPEELSQLGAQAEELAAAETAVTDPPQPDALSYRFTYRGRQVETDDGAMPQELAPLIGTFIELIDSYGPS